MSTPSPVPGNHEAALTETGLRIRAWRRARGLSLRTTAELAGLSPAFLSMVENGKRALSRWADVVAVAQVLHASPHDLVGAEILPELAGGDPLRAAMPAIRLAMLNISPPQLKQTGALPVAQLSAEVRAATDAVSACDYSTAAQRLPGLLARLRHAHTTTARHRAEVTRLLLRALQAVCSRLLFNVGEVDLACLAIEHAHSLVQQLDDPVEHGIDAHYRARMQMALGACEHAVELSRDTAEQMSKHAGRDSLALAIYGALHLQAAFAHACFTTRGDTAMDHFSEAVRVIGTAHDPEVAALLCSVPNTKVNHIELLGLLGRYDEAVHTGTRLVLPRGSTTASRAVLHTALGCCLRHLPGHETQAVTHLAHAARLSPQRFQHNANVRKAVTGLLTDSGHGRADQDLRGLARRIGITPQRPQR